MGTQSFEKITIDVLLSTSVEHAWKVYTNTEYVTQWNHASDDWHSPSARNDLREGGTFSYRMEAKDGSVGFDFEGTYTKVEPRKTIEYVMADGRTVHVCFHEEEDAVLVTTEFDAETENSLEMQRQGW